MIGFIGELLLGWVGVSFVVVGTVVALRAWANLDPEGPGTRRARRVGCTCPRKENAGGLREAVTGTSVLRQGCPVIKHHPEARRRMYIQGG